MDFRQAFSRILNFRQSYYYYLTIKLIECWKRSPWATGFACKRSASFGGRRSCTCGEHTFITIAIEAKGGYQLSLGNV
jgi:hypothetical protein